MLRDPFSVLVLTIISAKSGDLSTIIDDEAISWSRYLLG